MMRKAINEKKMDCPAGDTVGDAGCGLAVSFVKKRSQSYIFQRLSCLAKALLNNTLKF